MQLAGSFALPAEKLRRMIAASPTFQAATRTTNPDDAEALVFMKSAIGDTPRPYAVISPGQKHSFSQIAGDAFLRASGGLFLYLTMDTNGENFDDAIAAEFAAASFFGSVIDDVMALSRADDPSSPFDESHLSIVNADLGDFSANPEDDWQSLGRFHYAAYLIEWGD